LEVLKCGLLREDGVADDDCFHSRSLNGDQHSWVMTGNFRVGGENEAAGAAAAAAWGSE
jgi:hypothetical protein